MNHKIFAVADFVSKVTTVSLNNLSVLPWYHIFVILGFYTHYITFITIIIIIIIIIIINEMPC